MKDERKGPVGRGSPDIEGGLGRLAGAPVPQGLRRRVIDRALEARRNVALTPRLRTLAFVCATVILAVLVTDPLVGRNDAARLAALLNGQQDEAPSIRPEQELAEILGVPGLSAKRLNRLQAAAAVAARREREHRLADARRRLKGWLDNEALEDLI